MLSAMPTSRNFHLIVESSGQDWIPTEWLSHKFFYSILFDIRYLSSPDIDIFKTCDVAAIVFGVLLWWNFLAPNYVRTAIGGRHWPSSRSLSRLKDLP